MVHAFQVLAEAYKTLKDSIAAQTSKLSAAQREAEEARNTATSARAQV